MLPIRGSIIIRSDVHVHVCGVDVHSHSNKVFIVHIAGTTCTLFTSGPKARNLYASCRDMVQVLKPQTVLETFTYTHSTCIYMYMFLMRDEKEEASKVKQTNKAKQHSTSKAVTSPRKNELPQVGLKPTILYTPDRALYQLSYQGSTAGWAQISHLIVHLMNRLTINSV